MRILASVRVLGPALGRIVLGLSVLAAGGCVSYSYVDKDHNRHVIGFVNATIRTDGASGANPPSRALDMRSLGLSINSTGGDGVTFTLGYSHAVFVILPTGACVNLTAMGPCGAISAQLLAPTPQ